MFRRLSPVNVRIQYYGEAETAEEKKKRKGGRLLRHTSPSPSRSRLLRVPRNVTDATDDGGRSPPPPQNVKRCRSYHDIDEALLSSPRERLVNCSSASGGDLRAMTTTAAVPSNNPSVPVAVHDGGSADAKRELLAPPEEPRQRKPSGGSQKLNDMLSFGFRFGGKGNKEKKKKAKKDLPSPSSNPQSIGDEELTVFR